MAERRRFWLICLLLLLAALAFRLAVARYLANDLPDDSKVYSQLARNLLEQKVYSHSTEPPYNPTLIRMPGYPFFLAGTYSLFGEENNTAVRIIQACLDTLTCILIALIAFYWEPDGKRKYAGAMAALALAALCPFSTIYTATILAETLTIFLAVAMCLSATLAFRTVSNKRAIQLWFVTGVIAGIAVLFRPDSGLFAAALGITLIGRIIRFRSSEEDVPDERPPVRNRLLRATVLAATFSAAFCLVLLPWTIRNLRVFDQFQPLAPRHPVMPGEFVPRGYLTWVRTWAQDQRYVGPALFKLDQAPIDVDEIPDTAFDSLEEKKQVATLLEKYNYPLGKQFDEVVQEVPREAPGANESGTPNLANRPEDEYELHDQEVLPDEPTGAIKTEQDQLDAGSYVRMTPEIDAGFARIARERISRSPLRYYLSLPFRRAVSLWFDTHSQYYPFEGELMPLSELDRTSKQHIWLPLFAALTWIYTLLGVAGAWLLWRTNEFETRVWAVLVGLIVFSRLAFFASLENPEPRYVVEIFPFLAILGGLGIGRITGLRLRDWYKSKPVRIQ